MLIHTHILLANKLLFKVKGIGNRAKINRLAFYWGNIRPDIHSPFNRGTHMYGAKIDLIEKLWNYAEELPGFNGFLSSYYLGYVMHYIADFFTYAHNDNALMSDLSSHFEYENNLHKKMLEIDTTPLPNKFTVAAQNYYSNELKMYSIQSAIIKEIAEKESCVIVGRCADYILQGYENCMRIFIHADIDSRIERAVRDYGVDAKTAVGTIAHTDKGRAAYHKYYADSKWGDYRNYHLAIDSGVFGLECAADIIAHAAKDFNQ